MVFKLIVAGSRDFSDYAFLKRKLDHLLQNIEGEIEIISGEARGADKLGEQYANENGLKFNSHPADWDRYGKSAGYRRNEEMALSVKNNNNFGGCVVFRKNMSKGSSHMIDLATKHGLKLRVYDI